MAVIEIAMRRLLYISFIFFLGCRPISTSHVDFSSSLLIDSVDITTFNTDSMKNQIFNKDDKLVQLDKPDILICEKLLKDYIYQYNLDGARKIDSLKRYFRDVRHIIAQIYEEQFHIDLSKYGRQYIAVLNKQNHKIVYINCFCNPSEHDYKRKDWVFVMDGGNCFFQMKIDLTVKKVIEYSENGVA